MQDPEGFTKALVGGEVKMRGDGLYNPGLEENGKEDEGEEEEGEKKTKKSAMWPTIPTPQSIVRCPPINWTQYGVVGDSLDKLHKDQVQRPSEGMPQRIGPDGQLSYGGDGQKKQYIGPAVPLRMEDKFERMGTRKGGKR